MKKVGPNLYRAHTGRYYLLVKRAGKQFRRSLKTKDAKLAKRRLREFQEKAGELAGTTEDRKITFEELSARWLASRKAEMGGLVKRGTVPGFSRGPRPLDSSQFTYLVLSFTPWM